ncbi:phytanoyl-CoA dioxygenase, partial [bacterium]
MINANVPWVESPFFEEILEGKKLNENQTRIVKEYHQNGYVVISNLLPQSIVDQAKEDSETKGFNPDFEIKTQRDETRIQDFWQKSAAVKEIACYPDILEMLNLLYDRQAVPFQTLNFKVGTQQKAHSDTIHFSSLPARFMCGVWVALEDITEENGPVFYCPGSQRLPEYNFSHIQTSSKTTSYQDYSEYENFMENVVKVNSFPKKKFLAKKGDVLIWSSNIIHGGSPVTKAGSTRWSQ